MRVKCLVTKNTNLPATDELNLAFTDELLNSVREQATQQANWSWADIMVAFKEVGYDPSVNEKERIINSLIIKKAKSILIRKRNYDYKSNKH